MYYILNSIYQVLTHKSEHQLKQEGQKNTVLHIEWNKREMQWKGEIQNVECRPKSNIVLAIPKKQIISNAFSIIITSICSLNLLSYLRCEDLSSVCKIKLSEKCFDTSHKRLLYLIWLLWLVNRVFILSAV